jgi:hypothetical protein
MKKIIKIFMSLCFYLILNVNLYSQNVISLKNLLHDSININVRVNIPLIGLVEATHLIGLFNRKKNVTNNNDKEIHVWCELENKEIIILKNKIKK